MNTFVRLLVLPALAALEVAASAAEARPIPANLLRVEVRSSIGHLVAGADVACVPPDRPAHRPTSELTTTTGIAELAIPSTGALIFVAAPGYDVVQSRVEAGARSLAVQLMKSRIATGFVYDEKGGPVVSARVGHLAPNLAPPLASLSPTARALIAGDIATVTGENGSWSLPLPTRTKIPVLIEADGYEPALFSSDQAQQGQPHAVMLRAGSRLVVNLNRTDPDILISLSRRAEPGGEIVPSASQKLVWARQASDETLEWSSLPPGEYDIYGWNAEPLRFEPRPFAIGSVCLERGETATVAAVLPPPSAVRQPDLDFLVRGRWYHDLKSVHAYARSGAGIASECEWTTENVTGGTMLSVDAAGHCDAVTVVSDVAMVGFDESRSAPAATVSARGEVVGRLVPLSQAPLPPSGWIEYSDCEAATRLSITMAIGRDGSFAVPFPTTCGGAVLHVDDFESVVVPVRLTAKERRSLGDLTVRAAAEALVRVTSGSLVVPSVEVRATVRRAGRSAPIVISSATTGVDGMATLRGLPADEELIIEASEARTKSEGRVRFRGAPGDRLDLELPLVAPAVLELHATLSSNFTSHFPGARLRSVTLSPTVAADGAVRKTSYTAVVVDDQALVEQIPPGRWNLVALVVTPSDQFPVAAGEIELLSGRASRTLTIDPPIYRGVVLKGGRPITSVVGIRPQRKANAMTTYARAENGQFTAALTAPGVCSVTVQLLGGERQVVQIPSVDFADPDDRVTIELPSNSLHVRLRDGDDPVTGVEVQLTFRSEMSGGGVVPIIERGRSDAAGDVMFESLAPGVWLVEARQDDTGRTATTTVSIGVTDSPAVVLDLKDTTALHGVVRRSDASAVPYAAVECMYIGPAMQPIVRAVRADREGRFKVTLTAPAPDLARCSVIAPTGEAAGFVAAPGASVDPVVPARGGRLVIVDDESRSADHCWLLGPGAVPISVDSARRQTGPGGSIVLDVAPGKWKLVRVDTAAQLALLANGRSSALTVVATAVVENGKITTVTVSPH